MPTLRTNSVPTNSYVRAFVISVCVAALLAFGCSTRTAKSVPSLNPEAERLITEGEDARKASNFELAEQKFLEAAAQAKTYQAEASFAFAHVGIGLVYGQAGKHNEAIEKFSLALQYFKSNDLRAAEAEILKLIGILEDQLGNTSQALSNYNQALPILDELISAATDQEKERPLLQHRSATRFKKASAHETLGQFGDAVEYYRRAAQDDKSIGADDDAGGALWFAAGIVERELKDQEQAMGLYAEAVPLLLAANDRKSAAWASVSLGKLYIAAGKFPEAKELLLNSVKLGESLNLSDVVFSANYALATAFDNSGEFEQALPHYEAVIKQIRKGEYKDKNDEIYLYALKRARFICQVLGKYDLVIELPGAASLKYRERSELENEVETFAQLADLYSSLGDFEIAADYLRRVLNIVKEARARSDDARLVDFEAVIFAGINCCKSTCHFVVTRVVSTHGEENKEEARKR